MKYFGVVADSDLQGAFQHKVKFLSAVGRGVDGLILKLVGVFIFNPIRLGKLVAEKRRKVADFDTGFLGGADTLTLSCNGVGRKRCAVTFENIGDTDSESKGAFMDKGKRKIDRARLIRSVFVNGQIGFFRHFFGMKPGNFAHFTDSRRNLQYLIGNIFVIHDCYLRKFI